MNALQNNMGWRDEKGEGDVLSLVPESQREWFHDDEHRDAQWMYCVGVNHISKSILGRSTGPRFRCVVGGSGQPKYECRMNWHHGSTRIALTSGLRDSTREAFDVVCNQAQTLPTIDTLNWGAILKERLGYPGMRPATFLNSTVLGLPTIICTLSWGVRASVLEVNSKEHGSRILAFEDALQQAKAIGPAPYVSMKMEPKSKRREWASAARHQIQHRLPLDQINVSFFAIGDDPGVTCKIRWGSGLRRTVQTFPMRNEDEAFAQAMEMFKRDLNQLQAPSPKVKVAVAKLAKTSAGPTKPLTGQVLIRISAPLDAPSLSLLTEAKQRWKVERDWLMKMRQQSISEIQRLHELSTFFVLLDPLRCYEIDRSARFTAIGRIAVELQRIVSDHAPEATRFRHAAQLRALIGGRSFAEPGSAMSLSTEFDRLTRSKGFDPARTIAELVEKHLVRQLPTGELSLSTVGANLLEATLTEAIKGNSVGAALPAAIAAMLLDLKLELSKLSA